MRDWQAYVRKRLRPTGLRPAREARLVSEVAAQLEDLYRDAVLRGATDEEADRLACDHIADWSRLAADLAEADPAARLPAFEQRIDRATDRGSSLRRFWSALAALHHDLGHAVRILARRPGVAAVLVLTLALGMGAVVRTTGNPSAVLGGIRQAMAEASRETPIFAVQTLDDLRGESIARPRFAALILGLFAVVALALAVVGIYGTVSHFVVQRTGPGQHPVAIVSHRLWQNTFGGREDMVGHVVTLNRAAYTVVGVAPEVFTHHRTATAGIDLWVPLTEHPAFLGSDNWASNRDTSWVEVLGRLRPGVALGEANAALATVSERWHGSVKEMEAISPDDRPSVTSCTGRARRAPFVGPRPGDACRRHFLADGNPRQPTLTGFRDRLWPYQGRAVDSAAWPGEARRGHRAQELGAAARPSALHPPCIPGHAAKG